MPVQNKTFAKLLFAWTAVLLCAGAASGQVIRAAKAKPVAIQQTVLTNVLNAPAKQQTVKQDLLNISAGTKLISLDAQPSIGSLLAANQKMSILYGVPVRVGIDRYLLQQNVEERIGELLDLKTYWENSSDAKKKAMIKGYLFGKISEAEMAAAMNSATMPDAVVQQMVKLFQDQINQLQAILDNLYYNCPPVEFKTTAPTVRADIRFNSPVSGQLGFMRAGGNGEVNLSNLFDGISFGALESNPVAGTLLIYTR